MNCITNYKEQISYHTIACSISTIVAIALIILSTQNLQLRQFHGIGHIGSNIALGIGSFILLAAIILPCKQNGFKKTVDGYYILNREDAEKISKALAIDEFLFCKIGNEKMAYYVEGQTINITYDRGRLFLLKPVKVLTEETMNKALKSGNNFKAFEEDLCFATWKSNLYNNEYLEYTTKSGKIKYLFYFDNVFHDVEKKPTDMPQITAELLLIRAEQRGGNQT